ncbi:unnamed protein product [Adineta steineri]|uniref:Rab-GAP TBC domain-containing protein n=1 Tax=Adineta steineri TaxID=433720 RepID=A0A813N9R6_9BILA|nr:unnamed protein product [Adineta steineri]
MSTSNIPDSPSISTSEIDTERCNLRPQRPPPPPPVQNDFSTSIELATPSAESDITLSITDTPNNNVEDNRPSLLFEFNELFDSFDYESVRNKILNRQMTTCSFTTVLWRIFLHCLPRSSCQWNQIIDGSRAEYDELVEKYLLDLQKIRENYADAKHLNHPLSQEENSLWNQYYVYEELKENIYQDVIRTCQEIEFFRQKHVLDLLLRVLYLHSRHHGEALPYRQGMHEILAVIVYLIHNESVIINDYPESNEIMKKLYDPKYLAHDSYAIYSKIMDHIHPFYDFKSNNAIARKVLFQRLNDTQVQMNDTVMRVNAIFHRLKDFDRPLFEQLLELDIEPTVYGIRWLRLLFGREIPFSSIPMIFCYDECFAFVDFFFLALLMEIGQIFKKHGISEYSFCLQYLMQSNNINDVESVIQKALSLEKLSKAKESRLTSSYSALTQSNRYPTPGSSKPTSPTQNYTQNPMIDAIRNSTSTTPFILLSPPGKINSSKATKESEMNDYPGKEVRQQFETNIQIQKYCAEFMNKFIGRIRNRVCGLPDSNDEVLIQLNGLEQIANILEGTLTFDDRTLEALANYKQKEKLIENNNPDAI